MSFTTGGIYHQESIKLIELFCKLENWQAVRDKVIAENLLQARTTSSLKRSCLEILMRLKTLKPDEMIFFLNSSYQDQSYILWLAVCRRYSFIAEFAIEMLHERFVTLKIDLNPEDFDVFFNRKAEWYSELDEISKTSRIKMKQVLFKILKEANLLTANNIINAAFLNPQFIKLLMKSNQKELMYFPIYEADIRKVAQ